MKGVLSLLAIVLYPALLFAATGEHGESHGAHHSAGFWSLKYYLINFSIYALLIIAIARKKAPSAWAARRKSLEEGINSAQAKIKEVEKTYSEVKAKLSNVERDIQTIKTQASEETKRELEDINASTEVALQRIEKQVKDTITAQQRMLEKELKRLYAKAAVRRAEEKARKELNPQSDQALRERTLSGLKGLLQ